MPLFLGPVAADDPPAGAVTLRVVPNSTSVLVGDPMLLKGVLMNGSKEVAILKGPFDSFTYGVRIEVCPPGEKVFRRVNAIDEGLYCSFGLGRPRELAAGKTVVCYSRVFQEAAFTASGGWQVRISTTVDGKEVVSPPVTISVAARAEAVRDILTEFQTEIADCVRSGAYVTADDLRLALKASEALGSSELGRAVTQAHLLRTLRHTDAARPHALALAAVNKYRGELGPVAREDFDLSTAALLIDQKRYDDAKALLDTLPESSGARENLRALMLLQQENK